MQMRAKGRIRNFLGTTPTFRARRELAVARVELLTASAVVQVSYSLVVKGNAHTLATSHNACQAGADPGVPHKHNRIHKFQRIGSQKTVFIAEYVLRAPQN